MIPEKNKSRQLPFRIDGRRLFQLVPSLLHNPLPTLVKLSRQYGHLITFDAGKYQRIHVVSEPEIIKHILKTNAANYLRSPVIRLLKPWLGDGIFISEGEDWKKSHKLLKPAMHEAHMKSYLQAAEVEAGRFMNQLNSKGNSDVNVEPLIDEMMLRLLISNLFGDVKDIPYQSVLKSHKRILKKTSIEAQKLDFFKKRILGRLAKSPKLSYREDLAVMETVADQIIAHTDVDSKSALAAHLHQENADRKTRRDMVMNLLFAGYDTTASSLSMALYCLARHEKVQNEVAEDLQCKDYNLLKRVIEESLRIYPPVWSIHRKSVANDSIDGWDIGANSYFMIDINSLHRHPEHWENPDDFYPNHFLPENRKGKGFAYIPFGQGQRMCIGKPLAINEIEFMLSTILRKFHFTIPSNKPKEVRIRPDIIIKSRHGIYLMATPRT